jgi:hypothetical protein
LFVGRTVAVLASGPGLTESVVQRLFAADVPAIVVNTSYRRAPWAQVLYAADPDWWLHREHRSAWEFAGLRVTISTSPAPAGLRVPGLRVMRNAGVVGWSEALDELHTLGNSGAQAIQLAIKAGAAKVLLAGFDFSRAEATHWHGDHPPELKVTEQHTYAYWAERMAKVAPDMLRRADVVTVTPSALTCFRAGSLEDELCGAR